MTSAIAPPVTGAVRRLVVVLGDQLDRDAKVLADADPDRDAILMMEVAEEATHVPSHRQRTTLFLSAMRHFANDRARQGWRVRYVALDDPENTQTFTGEVSRAAKALTPEVLAVTYPGEHRVLNAIDRWRAKTGLKIEVADDDHFLGTIEDFTSWRADRKQLVLDHFYRRERKRLDILLTSSGGPIGGSWNYDAKNRQRFRDAPTVPRPTRFRPDDITRGVMRLVARRFPDAPGRLNHFHWPVTRREALRALRNFIDQRLAAFGPYQDAMWTDEPFLYHALLSPALNLKLIRPREVVEKALKAYTDNEAPLQSVEGFIRQVIGWREFIRGVYWTEGAEYGDRNALNQHGHLPDFYWTGETDMVCVRQAVGQVLETGYGHHIQRLMVTGNFALTAGVDPRAVSDWYLGMYVDAVDWVTVPNTLGMVMHADGGVVGTKPYAASGKYIQRMSNYCASCRFDPAKRAGDDACPFTVFYWDFLIRNRKAFEHNPRLRLSLTHVERMDRGERSTVRRAAEALRTDLGIGDIT